MRCKACNNILTNNDFSWSIADLTDMCLECVNISDNALEELIKDKSNDSKENHTVSKKTRKENDDSEWYTGLEY